MKYLMFLMIASATMVGCVEKPANKESDEATATTQTEEASQARVVRERQAERSQPPAPERRLASLTDPAVQLPQLSGELSSEGYGLEMLIDGSSPDAFLASLEMIASETSPEQFQQLTSALRYLQAYMLGPRNLSEFYQRLDAMTGQEVIELARQQRQRR